MLLNETITVKAGDFMKTKGTSFAYVMCFLVSLASIISIMITNGFDRKNEMDKCLDKAIEICKDYGFYNINTDIHYDYNKKVFYLNIDAEGAADKSPSEMIEVIMSLYKADVDYNNKSTYPSFVFDGKQYELMYNKGDRELYVDGNMIYTTKTQRINEAKEFYRNIEPYKGMSEDYINLTSFGKANVVDTSNYKDYLTFHNKDEYKKYIWKYPDGSIKAEATVRYWDNQHNRSTDGYISYITFYDQPIPTKSNYNYSSTKSKSKDYYNVEDYSDPEDFYYDYEDDFDDYYDAEDYYYDHID